MHTASADAAHLLTQAVLLAWLCHRYHDLATHASESLKQRIHFLAKPDGSNLQDLFIWDPPSSSSSSSCRWSSAQIQEYIQRHWSADQSPLSPPHPYSSWDAVPVYCKELDQETLHAIVPIGQQDHTTVVAVVLAVEAQHAPEEGDNSSSCWRYHNIVVIQESQLQSSLGWYLFPEWMALKKDSLASNDSLAAVEQEQANGSETAGDEDSDNDYWGQYNDSEDDDDSAEDIVSPTTRVKSADIKEGEQCDGDDDDDRDKNKDEDEDEDEYWRKYAEQQEQQDRDERKKKMQEPSAHNLGLTTTTTTTTTRDHEDLVSISNNSSTMQASTTVDSAAAGTASSFSPTLPGQLDPTMLSSLMQMLVAQGMDQSPSQSSTSPLSLPLPQQPRPPSTTQPSSTLDVDHFDSKDSKSRIITSLRSIVQDCHQAGFSKDEVFEMLQSVYSTPSLSFAE